MSQNGTPSDGRLNNVFNRSNVGLQPKRTTSLNTHFSASGGTEGPIGSNDSSRGVTYTIEPHASALSHPLAQQNQSADLPLASPNSTLHGELNNSSSAQATPLHQQGRLQMSSEKHVLAKLTDSEIIGVSNKMFYPGLFFLPWLLLTHNWYLYPVLQWPSKANIHGKLRTRMYVGYIVAAVYISLLIAWIAVYATQWLNWGAMGYKISLIIPNGK